MKILLLNKNPIISKLVKLSAEKIGYDFEEKEEYQKGLSADVIIIDSDVKADLKTLSENSSKLIYLSPKNQNNDDSFYLSIHKPFLPTDLINLIQGSGEKTELADDSVSEENKESPQDIQNDEALNLDVSSLDFDDIKDEKSTDSVSEENKESPQDIQNDEALNLDVSSLDFDDIKDEKSALDEGQDENFDESDLDAALKMSVSEKNEKIEAQDLDKDSLDTNFATQDKIEDEEYIFGSNEEELKDRGDEKTDESLEDELQDKLLDDLANEPELNEDIADEPKIDESITNEPSEFPQLDKEENELGADTSKEEILKEPSTSDKNPYDDMTIDLDSIKFDDLDDKKDNFPENIDESIDEPLEVTQDISNEEELKDRGDEKTDESLEDELKDKILDDLANEPELSENVADEPKIDENTDEPSDGEIKQTLDDEIPILDEPNKQDLQELEADISLDDEINLTDENDELDSETPFVVEEKEEEKINFDDIPNDAKFIGQEEEQISDELDIKPVLLDDDLVQEDKDKTVQEQIKEELAILDEMDSEKDYKLDDDLDIKIQRTDTTDSAFENDLENISQEDMQIALGEIAQDTQESTNKVLSQDVGGAEIIDELSKSIAGAINSSIKDETLKAALKGMNMNINISIKFGEDKD